MNDGAPVLEQQMHNLMGASWPHAMHRTSTRRNTGF
jgi:hypothetical protein